MHESADISREDRPAADDLAKQFWTLGNVIAGFCVLQELGFLAITYAAGDEAYNRALSAPYVVLAAVGLGTVIFAAAAWYCGSKETTLRRVADHPSIVIASARQVTVGRIICVIACYCVVVARLLHHII